MVLVKFVLVLLFGLALAEDDTSTPCTSFRNIPGNCIHVRSCPKIINTFMKKNRTAEDLTILRNVGCSNREPGYVCCEFNEEGIKQLNNTENNAVCGTFSQVKVFNGREVELHARPWLALLLIKKNENLEFSCLGSLITKRFVLIPAHCLINDGRELVKVRLGDHHLLNETYCTSDNRCERGHVDFGIEKIILHKEFNPLHGENDIALVKLANDVEYLAHIRPICLPLSQELREKVKTQDPFLLAGWGKMNENETNSNILMETRMQRTDCASAIHVSTINPKTQICAEELSSGICYLISGSPLTYPSNYYGSQRFVQFGILSYGPKHCGSWTPLIFTNVDTFLPWITENILQ